MSKRGKPHVAVAGRIAVRALVEVGRPDLAESVGTNRIGHPTFRRDGGIPALPLVDQVWVVRAFRCGHRALGTMVWCGYYGPAPLSFPQHDPGECERCHPETPCV